jgi:hypothetical protein
MTPLKAAARAQWIPITVGVLCTAALTLLLALGLKRAAELQSASAALQLASELSSRPDYIRSELNLMQRGLEARAWVGEPVRAIDQATRTTNDALRDLQANMERAGIHDSSAVSQPLGAALERWTPLARQLPAVTGATLTGLYVDSSSGSQLTSAGRELKTLVDDILEHETAGIDAMTVAFGEVAAELRRTVIDAGRAQRTLLLEGTALAALLLAMMLYFALRARRSAAAAASAQRQVEDIFATVREGLFLVDREMRIGDAHSDSLSTLLRAKTPSGARFEDLLHPLVDDKTLQAATRFLGLLWKDKVNEDLIESVNPLNQVEARFQRPQGGTETRYLSFSFRRVRARDSGREADTVLGTVADITDRVLLAQELEHVRADSESQAAMLLQVMKVDPQQLELFLGVLDSACRKTNAMLTTSGSTQDELRRKLNSVFRELHTLKGEGAAIGLSSVTTRIHAMEEMLSTLRSQEELSGTDFVPLVVRLDELMTHAASISQMQQRVASVRPTLAELQAPAPGTVARTGISETAARRLERGAMLEAMLRQITREVGTAVSREVRLQMEGLDKVPPVYAEIVKDICIQMVRNSVCHGIEQPDDRATAGKRPQGTIRISFADQAQDDYGLLIEDDGQGLDYEAILDKALRHGLLKPEQAVQVDRSAIFRLIFQPGFTTAERVSEHAGRGVGLDVVSAMIRERGGRIGVSTAPGQYTRFKILLPRKPMHNDRARTVA